MLTDSSYGKGDGSMTYYEPEFDPIIPPVDEVYEADENGVLKEMEVPDDATDD